MNMFQSVLETVPKTRSQMVNELDIPEDITVDPYVWREPDEDLDSDSTTSITIDDFEVATVSSESSLALSRAMTDSEIDYTRYRKLKNRSLSDPWALIRTANDSFPSGYLESLQSCQDTTLGSLQELFYVRHKNNDELKQKMERFFEEISVFTPDDPGLMELQEALEAIDVKSTDLDSDTS
ncbi:uncharacterized protein LOC116770008 [Danaus plexippus]|uniref:uncharacterized protein LOC116770008 n=1 Tax=Danaus plexippus TaxID=13037 RepID=UPI002AB069DA|nr:uncharacterized protein LOC116770008 [Danaus plexippus]